MTQALLERDAASGIATLTVNRPDRLNAIDVATARALAQAAAQLRGDGSLRCIVLRGAGRAFVAGGDLAAFAADFDHADGVANDLLDAMHQVVAVLTEHSAPVIASVHGAVAGAGLSLMLACDYVIAAQGARFLLAYDRIGAAPDCGGTYLLPRVLGTRRAMEFMLMGEPWDADTAALHGMVNRVVPADTLSEHTQTLARRLAAGPTLAYGSYKRLAAGSFTTSLTAHLEQERQAFCAATKTADFREGVGAFLEKRTANFSGQ